MDELKNAIEKIFKAGIGLVNQGLESSRQAIEKRAEKGEPLYEHAKESVAGAAGKVKKAFMESSIPGGLDMLLNGKMDTQAFRKAFSQMTKEELDALRGLIDEFYASALTEAEKEAAKAEAAEEAGEAEEPAEVEETEEPEESKEPEEAEEPEETEEKND